MESPEVDPEEDATARQVGHDMESDPEWYEKYGKNLAAYTHWLFGTKPTDP